MNTHARSISALIIAGALGATGGGCSFGDILGVHVPGRVQESALNDASLANTIAASVVADLECAWNNYVAGAALISD